MGRPRATLSLSVRIILLSIFFVALIVGALFLYLTAEVRLSPAQHWEMIAIAAGGISLLVLLLYGALHLLIVRPLQALMRTSRRLAAGDFVPPPLGERHDEIGQLARSFGDMAEALRQRELRLAVEPARWQEALRLEADRLSILSEIGQLVNTFQEVEEIFRFLVERVRDLIAFERFSIALLDRSAASWSVAYAHGMEDLPRPSGYAVGQGLPGWAMRTGKTVLSFDLAEDERAGSPVESELIAQGCRSAIIVPLQVEGAVVGTLNVAGQGIAAYGPSDLALMSLLGHQVETALQNARLLQRERRRAEQLRTLAEVSREITSIIEPEALLHRVGQIIQESFGYHLVNVGIVEGDDLVFRARVGDPDEVLPSLRVKVGQEGITGWVAGSGEPLLVNDVTQEARYVPPSPPEVDRTLSELTVPIVLGGEVLGVLDVQSTSKDAFRVEDLELLETLAGHLAIALQEARLLQQQGRQAEQLRALTRVDRQITSILDPESLLHRVGRIIQETFGYHRVNVGIVEGTDLVFRTRVGGDGQPLATLRFEVGKEGITGWVAGSGEPFLVGNVTQEPRYVAPPPPEVDLTLSELAVPITVGKRVIGVLDVQSTLKDAFSVEDLELLQTLAGHLAVALENARLYDEAQRRLQEQSALLATSASISSTLELGEVVWRVAQAMVRAMNVTACAISTWDQEAETVTLLAEYTIRGTGEEGWGAEVGQVFSLRDYPATAKVLRTGEPLVVNVGDLQADVVEKALLEEYNVDSLLMLPLRARDRVVGLVELYHDEGERVYSTQEIAFCQALANHAGLAVENARLYGRVQQERDAVELLYQVGQELSTALDLEEVLPRVLALAVEKTGAYRGSIIVLDPLGNPRHNILVREGLSPSVIRRLVQEVLRRGLAGWVAQHRRPAVVEDTAQDPRWLELPETVKGVRSALAVPLLRGDTLVGVLTLVHRQPGYFAESHLQLMTHVANQAAIAIDNARLLLDTQRRVAQLNALLEINQGLSSDLPAQELLELITFSAHGLLDASNTVLFLLAEDGTTLVPRVALGADSMIMREATLQVGEGVTGLVVQEQFSRIVNEAHLSPIAKSVVDRPPEPEAVLSVPLLQRGVAVGALTVGRYGEGVQFGPADQEIAELLASQAVVALNNARLYEQARRRADELVSLNRIARTVGSTLDLDKVLHQIITELSRSFRVEAGTIFLLDQAHQELFFASTLEGGVERFADVRIPVGVGIVGHVAQTAEPALVKDVSKDPRWYSKPSDEVGFVTRSILCVPLISRDRVIGVIQLLNKKGGEFDEQDLARLQGIGATVAVAIENAGLYQQTEEERGRLDAILTSTADLVMATDAQDHILLVNPAAAQTFGLDTAEVVGWPFGEALSHEGLRALFERAIASDRPITDELTLEEDITFYVNISPVQGAGGQILGHVAVMQDITTLKELDRMKSEFVATVSHDLKTPLTAIRGFADLVRMSGDLDPQQLEFIARIREITGEMSRLISDLLDIGKIEAGIELEQIPCDVGALAAEVVSDLEPGATEKKITVTLEIPEQVTPVIGDPERLKQVLMNLVGNAVKYTSEEGHVRVRIVTEDNRLITSVQDDGVGIAPRDQKQLFQKFYRVRSEQTAHIEGTGLGLAIARSIVERHGGRIWVESELGRGTTFFFSLPLSRPEEGLSS